MLLWIFDHYHWKPNCLNSEDKITYRNLNDEKHKISKFWMIRADLFSFDVQIRFFRSEFDKFLSRSDWSVTLLPTFEWALESSNSTLKNWELTSKISTGTFLKLIQNNSYRLPNLRHCCIRVTIDERQNDENPGRRKSFWIYFQRCFFLKANVLCSWFELRKSAILSISVNIKNYVDSDVTRLLKSGAHSAWEP